MYVAGSGIGALAVLAICLVAVRPTLLVVVAVGAALGSLGAAAVAIRRRGRSRPNERNVRATIAITTAIVAAFVGAGFVAIVVVAFVDVLGSLGGGAGIRPSESLPQVRPVQYEGDFELDEGEARWKSVEVIQVPFADLRSAISSTQMGDPEAPQLLPTQLTRNSNRLLGPEWHLLAGGGRGGQSLVFQRRRFIPVRLPGWPPKVEDRIRIGAIHVDPPPLTLVPESGSMVQVTAADGFVREIDSPSTTRSFNGEEVFEVELNGLDYNPDHRELRLTVANSVGRSWIFNAVDSISASWLIKILFAGVPGAIVWFFLARRLGQRYPEPPTGASGGDGSAA
jgi:hypothetical protein